jgi:hypothetical protein
LYIKSAYPSERCIRGKVVRPSPPILKLGEWIYRVEYVYKKKAR